MTVKKNWKTNRDIILFVYGIKPGAVEAVKMYSKKIKRRLKVAVICDVRKPIQAKEAENDGADIVIPCDFSADKKITATIKPYQDQLLAVTCRSEQYMAMFRKLIPHVPFLRTPSERSLMWSTDKLEMRRQLTSYDPSITPKYTLVKDAGAKSIKKIKKKISFPLVVKPASLAQSILVSICFHEEELATSLRKVLRAVRKQYKNRGLEEEPKVLVEQFLEGDQYSIDGYVGTRGAIYFCPPVSIKTGRSIGFDDFFGYQQLTPTTLSKKAITEAEGVVTKAVRALHLRSTTFHAEMIRTEKGWKIVEVGARAGGFRQDLYKLAFGFDHALNDILIHVPETPIISRRNKGYAAAMKFFAKKEGRLVKLLGVKKSTSLKSFNKIIVNKQIGDICRFAKNGGSSVFNIILFNKDRAELLGDIRRLESVVKIEVSTNRKNKNRS